MSLKKRSGSSTKSLAFETGLSRTMAIWISLHSLGMRAVLPSCICCKTATALFSHSVRPLSSMALCCGKFKPKLVQKSFLRKSENLHLDANPTTYAKRSLRKHDSHTQALRFGTAQPFWTLSQRCCSNKNTRTKANTKQKLD